LLLLLLLPRQVHAAADDLISPFAAADAAASLVSNADGYILRLRAAAIA